MDTYPTLLSPIDNFAFPHFQNQSPLNNAQRGKGKAENSLPHTPIQRQHPDWSDMTDGPQAQYPFLWDSPFESSQQMTASPWRPQVFRSISESYTDSPSSSSSFLSSATCSPWDICPSLASASPEHLPIFDDFTAQYPGPLHFESAGDTPATAFNTLSLSSPLRSPILLPYDAEPQVIEPYNLLTSQTNSPNFSSNALALDLTADAMRHSGHSQEALLFAPYGSDTVTPSAIKSMSTFPALPETSSSLGVPYTGGSLDGGFHSDASLFARATRRKTSRIDYSEQGYEGDSDDEYEEGASVGVSKRGKARTVSAAFPGDSDGDASEESAGRGSRKSRGPVRGKGGSAAAAAAAKRKMKRRHHCTHDGCTSSFTRVTDMERHVASVHRDGDTDSNRCSFCRKAFSREDAVLRHENDSCPMRPKKKAVERWA